MSGITAQPGALDIPKSRHGVDSVAGAYLFGAAMLISVFSLGAAYIALRDPDVKHFVPSDMQFDNYTGLVSVFGVILATYAAYWGNIAARVGNRRNAMMGFGLSGLLGLACLNIVRHLGLFAKTPLTDGGSYAVIVYSLYVVGGLCVAAGITAAFAGLLSSFSGNANPYAPRSAGAVPVIQLFSALSWIFCFAVIYLRK